MIQKRPPIVVLLGHIDHGKTTLIDYIAKTHLAEKEAGGITQKVSVYEIEHKGEMITFIDTPGHEDFTQLRQRGAKIADLAVLIIAGDEGIKPQTEESLEFIKTFDIPFVVAINKIDKPNADPEKVKSQLNEKGILVEDWGGKVPSVDISAKDGQGVEDLLDMILILAELSELKWDNEKPGEGVILEITKHPKKGLLVSLLIKDGQIKIGDYLTTSTSYGKIKAIQNFRGKNIHSAKASQGVFVFGFESPPLVGEEFKVADIQEIEKVKTELINKEKSFKKQLLTPSSETEFDYSFIIRADHFGSLEALEKILNSVKEELDQKIKIVKADVGPLTIEDIKLAKPFNSILISFNLPLDKFVKNEIQNQNLVLIEDDVIYQIKEKIKDVLLGKTPLVSEEKGELEVLAIFSVGPRKKTVGGKVVKGEIKLNQKLKIIREGKEVGKGKIISLQQDKVPVDSVSAGNLCGLIVETLTEIQKGDLLKLV